MSQFPKGFFVTGTDTAVGKTVVTAALAYNLKQSGKNVAVMKPVQTGTNTSKFLDIEFVNLVNEITPPIDDVCPYRFPDPVAPLLASKLAGQNIEIPKIKSAFQSLYNTHEVVLVEGAGGLLVPITEDYLMRDLAFDLDLPLVIVTSPRLGTLNHTMLTVESARSRGIKIHGIVINDFPERPSIAESGNPGLMISMTGEKILGIVYHDSELSVEDGKIGNIRGWSRDYFTEELCGNLDIENFLLSIRS